LRNQESLSQSRNSPAFKEPEVSLPCSQRPTLSWGLHSKTQSGCEAWHHWRDTIQWITSDWKQR